MEETKFSIGDIVQLKSGELKMTVKEVHESWALCAWHNANLDPKQERYDLRLLRKAKSSD